MVRVRTEREIVDGLMERIPRMEESERESIRREASIAHMREIGEAMDLVDSAKVWLGGSDVECDPGIRKAAG